MKNTYPNIKSKFWFKNGKVQVYPSTTRIRLFYKRLRGWLYAKVYFKVSYGIKENVSGKKEMFYNDATFLENEKKEAIHALDAFMDMK